MTTADNCLLQALTALKVEFIDEHQFLDVMHRWMQQRDTTPVQIMQALGLVDARKA